MRKFHEFFNEIAWFNAYARQAPIKKSIKSKIGDSVNNNRTLTVNQAIRYFTEMNRVSEAKKLRAVKPIIDNLILKQRRKQGLRRTDATDLSEFVTVYRQVVMNKGKYRRDIGIVLRGND